MRNSFRAWRDRLRASWEEQRRAQIVRHLDELYRRTRHLEAEYRDDALAAAVLAPRVAPALEGLAADAARTARALAGRIEDLRGTLPAAPQHEHQFAETMWGHLSPALDLERDLAAMLIDGYHEVRERDPATAEILGQARKDGEARQGRLMDLVARL